MRIKLLGTGTSTGVPELGCSCEVCTSNDIRDKRLRTSAIIECDDTRILIDCTPDFRQQMLPEPFRRIDAVLVTHHHYDHVAGLDDLRPYCRYGDIPIYAEPSTQQQIRNFMPYCFAEQKYPGTPNLELRNVAPGKPFTIGNIEIIPIRVYHGNLPIVGYRIGSFAYITDMSRMEPAELDALRGVDVLVINALRYSKPHRTHQTVLQALSVIKKLNPRRTYLTHIMHHMGLHAKIEKCLPAGVFLGYDGLEIIL
ncbi:MAG: MBL fold metallo-hydrolase [Bacteroidaceae bacterium]|nr:MBL fold metallo-hydrolase [Bacteroidaceae bacterium]